MGEVKFKFWNLASLTFAEFLSEPQLVPLSELNYKYLKLDLRQQNVDFICQNYLFVASVVSWNIGYYSDFLQFFPEKIAPKGSWLFLIHYEI